MCTNETHRADDPESSLIKRIETFHRYTHTVTGRGPFLLWFPLCCGSIASFSADTTPYLTRTPSQLAISGEVDAEKNAPPVVPLFARIPKKKIIVFYAFVGNRSISRAVQPCREITSGVWTSGCISPFLVIVTIVLHAYLSAWSPPSIFSTIFFARRLKQNSFVMRLSYYRAFARTCFFFQKVILIFFSFHSSPQEEYRGCKTSEAQVRY